MGRVAGLPGGASHPRASGLSCPGPSPEPQRWPPGLSPGTRRSVRATPGGQAGEGIAEVEGRRRCPWCPFVRTSRMQGLLSVGADLPAVARLPFGARGKALIGGVFGVECRRNWAAQSGLRRSSYCHWSLVGRKCLHSRQDGLHSLARGAAHWARVGGVAQSRPRERADAAVAAQARELDWGTRQRCRAVERGRCPLLAAWGGGGAGWTGRIRRGPCPRPSPR